jgi:aminopeptidase N
MTILLIILTAQFSNFEYRETPGYDRVLQDSLHSFDVRHYLINVELPMTSRYISGCVTTACRSNQNNLLQIDLQLAGLNVDSIRVDGVTAAYTHTGDTIRITLPSAYDLNDSFYVKVGYSGTPSGQLGYIFSTSYHTTAYTLGCPFATKRWMPCYDNMIDKADRGCEMYITVPDTYNVCATGKFIEKTMGQGKATFHWKHDYPISPYLIHFSASSFRMITHWYRPAPAESIEVRYYMWPADTVYAPVSLSLITDMMGYYDSLFGAYPFERYGMDFIYPFYYGGMEHQTNATIIRSWLVQHNHYGMAHELSHMWWGDMATCFSWRHVWINEGFATYCDALYQGHIEGQASFMTVMLTRRSDYFTSEGGNPHSVYDPPENLLYDWGHSYCKGAWILHMMRYLCGTDSVWLRYMGVVRDSFGYKSVSTDDLNRIMNRELAGNYDWFFSEWVYQLGYPNYQIAWNKIYESPNWRLVLDVAQAQTIGPAVFHMPLPIGVNYAAGDTLLTLSVTQAPQHYEYLLPQEPTGITVDPDNWLIQISTVTGVGESGPAEPVIQTDEVSTVNRQIRIRLTANRSIRVFDALGREVYRNRGRKVDFRPSSAGIYYVLIDQDPSKYVIVK